MLPLAVALSFLSREGAAGEPFNVWLLGRIHLPNDSVYAAGRYAYVGTTDGFGIYDVSNPRSPVRVGYFFRYDWLHGIDGRDGTILSAEGTEAPSPSYQPEPTPGIEVRNGLAYCAEGGFGLLITDVTKPTTPTLRGSCNTPGFAWSVSVSGALAFVADDTSLQIIDVSNPSSPTLRASVAMARYATDVSASGNLAFVPNGRLHIVDATNPSSPVLRSSWGSPTQWPFGIWNVFVSNGIAYATATTGTSQASYARLLAIDVRNPSAPRLLGSYNTASGGGGPIYVSGRYAYAMLGDSLRIFDISTPSSPKLCGYYPYWGEVFACAHPVYGNLVYVANHYSDVRILQFTGRPAQATHWNLYR